MLGILVKVDDLVFEGSFRDWKQLKNSARER
jgi:hypothetical protein